MGGSCFPLGTHGDSLLLLRIEREEASPLAKSATPWLSGSDSKGDCVSMRPNAFVELVRTIRPRGRPGLPSCPKTDRTTPRLKRLLRISIPTLRPANWPRDRSHCG